MRRPPRLRDVARAAGVSIGTASNVLNKPEGVRPATRARVYEAMRALGYSGARLTFPAATPSARPGDPEAPLLVAAGYLSIDTVVRLDQLPHRGDRLTAQRISKHVGGPAAGVAAGAAALGAPFPVDVELATAIGDDDDSRWAVNSLARRGVRTRAARPPAAERLSRCIVMVEPGGHRTRINEPLNIAAADILPALAQDGARRRRHLHVEGFQAAGILGAAPALRAAGWTLSIHDTGLPAEYLTPEGIRRLADSFDTVMMSRRAAAAALRVAAPRTDALLDALAALARAAPGCELVVTLDADGAAACAPGRPAPETAPALPVEIVDGTGAGDCFAGVYLAQRLHEVPLAEALRRACIAGSLAMTAEGAQGRTAAAAEIDGILHAEFA